MSATLMSTVVRQVRKLTAPSDSAVASDAHLLERIRAAGDEAAFATLVRRHGPLVMGVCRRVLRHHQDAEDAFQATFLVLAKNAASIRRGTALASWLYGVARRVAADARRTAARRQARERRGTNMGHAQPDLEAAWRELQAVLAQEVERMPQKYQLPFVLHGRHRAGGRQHEPVGPGHGEGAEAGHRSRHQGVAREHRHRCRRLRPGRPDAGHRRP